MDRGFGAPMQHEAPVAAKEAEEQVFHVGSPFSFAEGMREDSIKIIHDTFLSDLSPDTKKTIIGAVAQQDKKFFNILLTWWSSQQSDLLPKDVLILFTAPFQIHLVNLARAGLFDQVLTLASQHSDFAGMRMKYYLDMVNDPIHWSVYVFDNAKQTLQDWMAKMHAEKRKADLLEAEMRVKRSRHEVGVQVGNITAQVEQIDGHNVPPGFDNTARYHSALGLPHNSYGYTSPARPGWNKFGDNYANSHSDIRLGHVKNSDNSAGINLQQQGNDRTFETQPCAEQKTTGRVFQHQLNAENHNSSSDLNAIRFGNSLRNVEGQERAPTAKLIDIDEDNNSGGAEGTYLSLPKNDNSKGIVGTMKALLGFGTNQHSLEGQKNADDKGYGSPPMQSTYQSDYGHQNRNTYGLNESPMRAPNPVSRSTSLHSSVISTTTCTISTNKNKTSTKSDGNMKFNDLKLSREEWETFNDEKDNVVATSFEEEEEWTFDSSAEKKSETPKPSTPPRSHSNSRSRQMHHHSKPRSPSPNTKYSAVVAKKRSESPKPSAPVIRKRVESPRRPLLPAPVPRKRSESPKFKATRQPKLQALNILLLGETGVGKTTFINGLANYLKFETLEGAMTDEPTILIDTSFTITGTDNKTRTITAKATTGVDKSTIKLNERLGASGTSSTQEPVDHVFEWNDEEETKLVRLIDTPGINDTRGTEQDAKNFEKILKHIAELGELHAICIVMKPNESKFTVGFRYCLDELLVKLHKSATKNILFCFTNTRSTLYRPGDTIATLHEYLENLYRDTGIRIKANKPNIFCYDNESFRYLCLLRQLPKAHKDSMMVTYSESWVHNVKECALMLKRVQGLTAHVVEDSLVINNARKVVTALARPLAEMARNHVVNMNLIQDQLKEVENLELTGQSLDERLFQEQVVMVPVPLLQPRTVCTSPSCVDLIKINDYESMSIPKVICHDNCYLTNVPEQTVNNQELAQCMAFDGGKCKVCGCPWQKHMHITYVMEKRTEKLMDREASRKLERCSSEKRRRQVVLKELNEKLAQLQHEHDIIRESCAEFAVFLTVNSLKKTCDPFADYLTYLVQNECDMYSCGAANGDLLSTLLDIQEDYQKRVDFIKNEIEAGRRDALTTSELNKKIINLEKLKESGPAIAKLMEDQLLSNASVEVVAPPKDLIKETKKRGDHKICENLARMALDSDEKKKEKPENCRSNSSADQKNQKGRMKRS